MGEGISVGESVNWQCNRWLNAIGVLNVVIVREGGGVASVWLHGTRAVIVDCGGPPR